MKILYIIPLLCACSIIYAQQNKPSTLPEDQTLPLRQIKEQEAKILKENQNMEEKKTASTGLVSDHGLKVKSIPPQVPADRSGKLIPNTASLEEIIKAIPNRQAQP